MTSRLEDLEPVICDAVRTPVGRFRGALAEVRADDLAGVVLAQLMARTDLPVETIDDVILGCANQAGEDNRNVARMALLLAGLPQEVPGVTVNRLCGSGLEAVWTAARSIRSGEGDLILAGGVESMTRAPYAMPKPSRPFPMGAATLYDTSLGWRFPNPRLEALFPLEAMGETAENVVARLQISREDQDAYALQSHQRAVAAAEDSLFDDEMMAVEIPVTKGPPARLTHDEGPRKDTSLQKLSALRTVFRQNGTVTAGNSSTLNDGAAALLVASAGRARELGLDPLARIVGTAVAGVDPRLMGMGPVPAVRKLLNRCKIDMKSIDYVEINEAFAATVLAAQRELAIDPDRLNVRGGAIALGHPLGCSGARILTTLLYTLRREGGRYGLATMCIGVGQGIAMLIERL